MSSTPPSGSPPAAAGQAGCFDDGDLLFVLARYANHAVGTADVIWAPRA